MWMNAEVFFVDMGKEGVTRSSIIELSIHDSLVRVQLVPGRVIPKLCFLGPEGSHTEEAMKTLLGVNTNWMDISPVAGNRQVVKSVDSKGFDLGIVALVNASGGSVTETQKAMVNAKETLILGDIVIPVHHMLIGHSLDEIKRIYSHPQALDQCGEFLDNNFKGVEFVATRSTSEAVEEIVDRKDAAAVASRDASEKFGVPILKENIEDSHHNATRFLLIGRGETVPTGTDTTIFTFIPRTDQPGILADCLQVFKVHHINLSDIQTHQTGQLDNHIFFAALEGHMKDERVAHALELLGDYCSSVKVLGSYKRAPLPIGVKEPDYFNGDDKES